MYRKFFGLTEAPFAIEPNPRFIVLGEDHHEALATMVYAVDQQEGWALLLGEPGVGKTTLITALLKELEDRVIAVVVTNPRLEPLDFYNIVALELGLDGPFASKGQFLVALSQFLSRCRREGRVFLLVVDEAHSLLEDMIEELRLLGNLDDASPRVLNIFLVGQLEILRLLKRSRAKGLMQRLRRYHLLKPMDESGVADYVRHRMSVAGGDPDIFGSDALTVVCELSGGNPRLVNALCDDALLLAFIRQKTHIDAALVREAAKPPVAGVKQVRPPLAGAKEAEPLQTEPPEEKETAPLEPEAVETEPEPELDDGPGQAREPDEPSVAGAEVPVEIGRGQDDKPSGEALKESKPWHGAHEQVFLSPDISGRDGQKPAQEPEPVAESKPSDSESVSYFGDIEEEKASLTPTEGFEPEPEPEAGEDEKPEGGKEPEPELSFLESLAKDSWAESRDGGTTPFDDVPAADQERREPEPETKAPQGDGRERPVAEPWPFDQMEAPGKRTVGDEGDGEEALPPGRLLGDDTAPPAAASAMDMPLRGRQAPAAKTGAAPRRGAGSSRFAGSLAPKRSSGFAKRLIILLILAAIIAGAYFFFTRDGMVVVKRVWDSTLGEQAKQAPTLIIPEQTAGSKPPAALKTKTEKPRPVKPAEAQDWGPTIKGPESSLGVGHG